MYPFFLYNTAKVCNKCIVLNEADGLQLSRHDFQAIHKSSMFVLPLMHVQGYSIEFLVPVLHLHVVQTAMAGLLWAISSVLDIDGALIDSPASALSGQARLMRILLIHESIKQALLDLGSSRNKVPADTVREITSILSSALDSDNPEEQVICIACIGGFSEALCVSDKTGLDVVSGLFQRAQMICSLAKKSGVPCRHLLCCFAVCVSRVFRFIGDSIGSLEELLEYSMIALSDIRFGIDNITQDPGAGQHISQQERYRNLREHLVINATWSMTNMCSEILTILPPQHSWEILQAIARISHHLQEDYFELLGTNSINCEGQSAIKKVGKSLNNAFLILVKLLNSAFIKLSSLEDSIPVCSGNSILPNLLLTRYVEGEGVASSRGMATKTAGALLVIETLGNLQFCRVADQEYEQLLGAALKLVMASPLSAQLYTGLFPEYKTLLLHDRMDGTRQKWEGNPMVIAKLMFLMRLAPLTIRVNDGGRGNFRVDDENVRFEQRELEEIVKLLVPYAYLLLHHVEASVREVAHQFFYVLLTKLGGSGSHIAEMLAPYYIDQCLAQPRLLPVNEFEQNVGLFARILPENGLSLKYCLHVLSEDIHNLVASGERKGGIGLFQTLCKCLLWFPLSTLSDCMEAVQDVVVMEGGQETMPVLFRLIGSNKDYTRKIELARFYTNILGSMSHSPKSMKSPLCTP